MQEGHCERVAWALTLLTFVVDACEEAGSSETPSDFCRKNGGYQENAVLATRVFPYVSAAANGAPRLVVAPIPTRQPGLRTGGACPRHGYPPMPGAPTKEIGGSEIGRLYNSFRLQNNNTAVRLASPAGRPPTF